MLRRYGILGMFAVLVTASVLLAREGTVYVKSPQMNMHGDITEHDTTVDVASGGTTATFQKSNVTIVYNDDVPNLIAERLAKLQPNDVQGRIDLAQFALDFKRYGDAQKILTDAQKLDPGNSRVSNMLASIDQMSHPQPPPATGPATPPGPVPPTPPGPDQANSGPGPTTSAAPTQLRLVTPDEINQIRLDEWQDGQLKVQVHVDPDARKGFIAASGMPAAQFVNLSPAQQGWLIYTQGDKQLLAGVHLKSDPPALLLYRQVVQHQVVAGCAASACHGDKGTGSFKLFGGDGEAAVYTDFLILNKFGLTVDGKAYPMINREQPQESLLLNMMLAPELATVPHPKVDGYHGMCHTRTDPKYVAVLGWIRDSLNPVRPTYDIDLTKPAPKKRRLRRPVRDNEPIMAWTPATTLIFLMGASGAAAAIDGYSRRRRRAELRALAGQWQMHYSERDQLRLAARVAEQFPIVGIANLQVSDIIYGRHHDVYRYIFTAQFTTGIVRTKHRPIRVASFVEPRDSRQPRCIGPIELAPADKPILEQYQSLAPPGIAT